VLGKEARRSAQFLQPDGVPATHRRKATLCRAARPRPPNARTGPRRRHAAPTASGGRRPCLADSPHLLLSPVICRKVSSRCLRMSRVERSAPRSPIAAEAAAPAMGPVMVPPKREVFSKVV